MSLINRKLSILAQALVFYSKGHTDNGERAARALYHALSFDLGEVEPMPNEELKAHDHMPARETLKGIYEDKL